MVWLTRWLHCDKHNVDYPEREECPYCEEERGKFWCPHCKEMVRTFQVDHKIICAKCYRTGLEWTEPKDNNPSKRYT